MRRIPRVPSPQVAALLALFASFPAQGQQIAPSQHSPAQRGFSDLREAAQEADSEAPLTEEESVTSRVTVRWNPIAQATRYVLRISKDPDLSTVFFTVETLQTSHGTPALEPGAYYYVVEGFEGDRAVGKTSVQPMVVGKPLDLSARRAERLPAPTIIGPKHMALYPAQGYVRLSWTPVEGARGYRFRLWDEDKIRRNRRYRRDTPPRWVTEVPTPWIEVRDAPYSSYMYLDSGLYRWDVAAIGKDGALTGYEAMGYFETSKRWFLKPSEFFFRFHYGLSPAYFYQSTGRTDSGASRETLHRFRLETEWYFARQWGIGLDPELRFFSYDSPVPGNAKSRMLFFSRAALDVLFRAYLSTTPWGWTFTGAAGLGMEEFPQLDRLESDGTSSFYRPVGLGANLWIRFQKLWRNQWELQWRVRSLIQAFTLRSSGESGSTTNTALNLDTGFRLMKHWTNTFATSLGLDWETRRLDYIPLPQKQNVGVLLQGWTISLGIQFKAYSEPERTAYYVDPDTAAYYPPNDSISSKKPHTLEPEGDRLYQDRPWQR